MRKNLYSYNFFAKVPFSLFIVCIPLTEDTMNVTYLNCLIPIVNLLGKVE